MIVVHHLNDSRSQRVLWLLEELGLPYEIQHYSRDATTRLAPPAVTPVHPPATAPVLAHGRRHRLQSRPTIRHLARPHARRNAGPPPPRPAAGAALAVF